MEFICGEWGHDRLWTNLSLVFMLRCSNLNETLQEKQSLYEILCSHYPTVMEEIDQKSFEGLEEKVLIIIDGVDEMANIEQIVEGEELTTSQTVFRNLLMEEKKHRILITGRPDTTYCVKQMMSKEKPVTYIQTVGLSREQVHKFIRKYFKTETHEGYIKLFKMINENPSISSMCKVRQYC